MNDTRQLIVRYVTVRDFLGKASTGWVVIEHGQPGYPFASKEKAVAQANAIASIRTVNGQQPAVLIEVGEPTSTIQEQRY